MTVRQKNVWIVHGEDAVLCEEKKSELITRYFRGSPPELTLLDAASAISDYRYALGGSSLFSTQTAVVAQGPYFFKKALRKDDETVFPAFLSDLKELSEDIFIVFVCDGKPDKRLKASKELFKIASDLECGLLKAEDAVAIVEERLNEVGKRLAPNARAYLYDVLESWVYLSRPFLMTECDKWILMAGAERMISKQILSLALPDYMDRGIFRFVDSLLARDAAAVTEAADHVFTDIDTTLKNTGFIASRFRKIKMLKEMNRAHVPPTEKMKRLEVKGTWALRRLEEDAGKMSEKEAEDFLLDIFRVQYAVRSGADADIKDVLLRFCLKKKA